MLRHFDSWLIDCACEKNNRPRKIKSVAGDVRESNPGPLAPKARIIPLDQHPLTGDVINKCRGAVPCTHAAKIQYRRPSEQPLHQHYTPTHYGTVRAVQCTVVTSTSTSRTLTQLHPLYTSRKYKHDYALLIRTPSLHSAHSTLRINNRVNVVAT